MNKTNETLMLMAATIAAGLAPKIMDFGDIAFSQDDMEEIAFESVRLAKAILREIEVPASAD